MEWKNRRRSENVEDRRGTVVRRGGSGGGAAAGILAFVMRRFGLKGIIILVIGFFALWKLGVVDPSMLMESGGAQSNQDQVGNVVQTEREQELFEFVSVVLASTEEVWTEQFARRGLEYKPPTLVIYRKMVRTACGMGSAKMGPFYCPLDQNIYIDLSFYDELEQSLGAPGDFAQAYVLAHEVGHHVQKLLGMTDKVHARRKDPEYNQLSVRLELQADYYSGVWAHHNKKYLEEGDIEEAMRAAYAVGDDNLQRKTQGRVLPHAFTHGTSEQRMTWFMRGMKSGDFAEGDTFSVPYSEL